MGLAEARDLLRRPQSEEGQTMAEYGVILAVLAVATVGIFSALAGGITATVDSAIDLLTG